MKIKLTEKTNFEGVTYYHLYINDTLIKLSQKREDLDKAIEVATEVYKSGKHIETVISEIEL